MADLMLYLGVSSMLKHALFYYWRDKIPTDAVLSGFVSKLNVYPVKSAREISLQDMDCTSDIGPHRGLIVDRQWMVVSADNTMITIRQKPKMNTIQPHFDGAILRLTSPGYEDVTVDVESVVKKNDVIKTSIEGCLVSGLDCGGVVSKWLSDVLEEPGLRLMFAGSQLTRRHFRFGNKLYNHWTKEAKEEDKLFYQDVSPFHLLGDQSVADLSKRLGRSVDPMQFRPNILVSSKYGPYDEDNWKEIYIGKVRFRTIKLCDRCTLPTVSRETCIRDKDNEPLRTLKSYRSFVSGLGPMFGTDLVVDRPGTIRVGDPVYVIRGDVLDLRNVNN